MNTPSAQTEFLASGGGNSGSHCDRMLQRLREAGDGVWVEMPDLARAAAPGSNGNGICVPRRIYDLRKKLEADGYTIQNVTEHHHGQCHSFYRIVRKPESGNQP